MSTIQGFGSPLPVDSKWRAEKVQPKPKPVKKASKKPVKKTKKPAKKVRKEDLPWN